MTGLEKIIQTIEADARVAADAIISQANTEADGITAAARAQVERKCAEIAMKSELDVKSVLGRAESGAALQEKKFILDAKQQTISDIIAKAKDKLLNLPDSGYFDVILQIIKNHAHKKAGKIVFSAADLKRMPKDYNSAINNVLSSIPGASLTIADESAELTGGFILVYGDIEENCSFDALFSAAKDDLQDKVNALLFE